MTQTHSFHWTFLLKAAFAGFLYFLGAILFGAFAAAIHFHVPNLDPPGTNLSIALPMFALSSALIGLALLPLALNTRSSRIVRALVLFVLIFVCLGVNAVIELTIFSTYFVHGGAVAVVVSMILPSPLCALALSYSLPIASGGPAHHAELRSRSNGSWLLRVVAAILAFPVIYFCFGAMVGPFVVDFYRSGASPLVLPPLSTILPVQVVRSSLFLLASAPFLSCGPARAPRLFSPWASPTVISLACSDSFRLPGCRPFSASAIRWRLQRTHSPTRRCWSFSLFSAATNPRYLLRHMSRRCFHRSTCVL